MTTNLKSCSWATSASCERRKLSLGVLFQLTMNPSIPAALAMVTCRSMTERSSLE